jgi:NADH:ubiquinone oxidoreductase subunit C
VPEVLSWRDATGALLAQLAPALGSDFLEAVSADDMDEAAILPGGLLAAVDVLRKAGFNHLLDIGGTDHLPLTPRFEVSYHFLAFPEGVLNTTRAQERGTASTTRAQERGTTLVPARFRLRVFADDTNPVIPSLTAVWPNADWAEREVWDLFGVRFDGHPDLRRILMPDDWEGYPLRKDYPLRGLNRRFSPGGKPGAVPPPVTK